MVAQLFLDGFLCRLGKRRLREGEHFRYSGLEPLKRRLIRFRRRGSVLRESLFGHCSAPSSYLCQEMALGKVRPYHREGMMSNAGFIDRLISLTYPRGSWEKSIVMLQAFIDESGIHDGARFCVVVGYMGSARHWKRFEELWKPNSDIQDFHAKRFFQRDPQGNRVSPYKEWDDAKAQAYYDDLLNAIASVNIYPIGGIVDVAEFWKYTEAERAHLTGSDRRNGKRTLSGAPTKPYYLAFQQAIASSLDRLTRKDLQIHFTFDQQEEFAPLALEMFQYFKQPEYPYAPNMGDAIYTSRQEAIGLQAADLLCYCWSKRITERSQNDDILRFAGEQKVRKMTLFDKGMMDKLLGKIPVDTPSVSLTLN